MLKLAVGNGRFLPSRNTHSQVCLHGSAGASPSIVASGEGNNRTQSDGE
jgi:hypothetical protein